MYSPVGAGGSAAVLSGTAAASLTALAALAAVGLLGAITHHTAETSSNTDSSSSSGQQTVEAVQNLSLPTGAYDAFVRLRVSNPVTLIDVDHISQRIHPLMVSAIINTNETGQNRYDQAGAFPVTTPWTGGLVEPGESAFVNISVDTANRRIVYQTIQYVPYQPGKSRLAFITGVLALEFRENVTFRMGVFDDGDDLVVDTDLKGNGFWLQASGANGDLAVVRKVGGFGTTVVPQSEWNQDKLDGTGPSGYVYDATKTVLLWIDQAWLGVGDVEIGIIHNSEYLIAHTFNHDGLVQIPYTQTAALPIRYDATTAADFTGPEAVMRALCSSLVSDGGYNPGNYFFSATLGTATKTFSAAGPWYNLILVRPDIYTDTNRTRPRMIIRARAVSVLSDTTAQFLSWRLLHVHPDNIATAEASSTLCGTAGIDSGAYACIWAGVDHNTYSQTVGDNHIASGFAGSRTSSLYEPGQDSVFGVFSTFADIGGHPSGLLLQAQASSANDAGTASMDCPSMSHFKMHFPEGGSRKAFPETYMNQQRRKYRPGKNGIFHEMRLKRRAENCLTIEQIPADEMAQVVAAYSAFSRWFSVFDNKQPPAKPGHKCDGARCVLTQPDRHRAPDVFICHSSGNFHICNPQRCYKTIKQVDGEVCPLTALVHPANFAFSAEYYPVFDKTTSSTSKSQSEAQISEPVVPLLEFHKDETYDKVEASFKILNSLKGIGPALRVLEPEPDPETQQSLEEEDNKGPSIVQGARALVAVKPKDRALVCLPTPSKDTKRKREEPPAPRVYKRPRHANLKNANIQRERFSIYQETLKKMFKNPKDFEKHWLKLATMVDNTYHLVVNSPEFSHDGMQYRVKLHCLAVVYLARQGLPISKPHTIWVIPELNFLNKVLKKKKQLSLVSTVHITTTIKMFKHLVSQCCTANLEACQEKNKQIWKR